MANTSQKTSLDETLIERVGIAIVMDIELIEEGLVVNDYSC